MKTYEFTLVIPDVTEQTADAVYGTCADASLGRSNGITYVAFDREAESLESAISSAVADVESVGVRPVRVQMELSAAAPSGE